MWDQPCYKREHSGVGPQLLLAHNRPLQEQLSCLLYFGDLVLWDGDPHGLVLVVEVQLCSNPADCLAPFCLGQLDRESHHINPKEECGEILGCGFQGPCQYKGRIIHINLGAGPRHDGCA